MTSNNWYSLIDYLIINHSCTFVQLSILTTYTHKLVHVHFMHTINPDRSIQNYLLVNLFNLTKLGVYLNEITFKQFKIFISKINSKSICLLLTILMNDMDYPDDNR